MLTNQQLIEIINDLDPEVETVFRKYSSFYATAYAEVEASDQEYTDYDISSLFGKRIVATGYWSDNDGLDLYETWVESKTLQHIPEDVKIIPAHTKEIWTKEE